MSDQAKHLKEMYRLIYDATTRRMPNFGGHHGIYGHQQHVGQELLSAASVFVSKVASNSASDEDIEQLRAKCQIARATDTLADSDLEKINKLLGRIKV